VNLPPVRRVAPYAFMALWISYELKANLHDVALNEWIRFATLWAVVVLVYAIGRGDEHAAELRREAARLKALSDTMLTRR
jgi:hypothetical protein